MGDGNDPWDPGTPVESNRSNWEGDPALEPPEESSLSSDGLTAVDLFCGCGGFSVGFSWAGFEPVLATDIHVPSVQTYRANHSRASMIIGDMREVPDGMIEEGVGDHQVDLLAAGVPCQGFSRSNRKRSDDDERNYLFREFIRVADLLNPKVILLENVSGLKSAADGRFREEIAGAMESVGYTVDSRTLNAADYGVPQDRRRVFFLGVSEGLDLRWPGPTHGPGSSRSHVTVWEAIGDLPQIETAEKATAYDREPFTEYQQFMRDGATKLYNHSAPNHHEQTVEKIQATEPGEPIYERFKQRIRLHPDATSPTQVAGGIRPQYQLGHPKIPRGLTVRERCRIQSFPDSYQLHGGVVQSRVQTGNAVPPLLARAIGEEIAAIIEGEPRTEGALSATGTQLGIFD